MEPRKRDEPEKKEQKSKEEKIIINTVVIEDKPAGFDIAAHRPVTAKDELHVVRVAAATDNGVDKSIHLFWQNRRMLNCQLSKSDATYVLVWCDSGNHRRRNEDHDPGSNPRCNAATELVNKHRSSFSNPLLDLKFTDEQKTSIEIHLGKNMLRYVTSMKKLIDDEHKKCHGTNGKPNALALPIQPEEKEDKEEKQKPDPLTEKKEKIEKCITQFLNFAKKLQELANKNEGEKKNFYPELLQAAKELNDAIATTPEIKNEGEWLMYRILSAIVVAGAAVGITLGAGATAVPLIVAAGVIAGGGALFTVSKSVARYFSPTLKDYSETVRLTLHGPSGS